MSSPGPCARRRLRHAGRRDAHGRGEATAPTISPTTEPAARGRRRRCASMMRCASAAGATAFTSSGETKSRPMTVACACAARSKPRLARGDAPSTIAGMVARRVGDVEHVVEHRVRAVHVAHRGDRRRELGGRRDRLERVERVDTAGPVEDLALGGASGQARAMHTSAKRSSWLSGSGKVPALPNGFCVATRKNGSGSGCVTPSTVTWRSSIGSSSAACVRGDARFTSSTSTTLAKIGPGRKSHSPGAPVRRPRCR